MNFNARSLKAKENEFFNFLRVHNVHVAVITETFLKGGINLKSDPNYKVHTNNRESGHGGGVAIVMHRDMNYRTLSNFKLKVIESLGVEVETSFGKIMIAAAYLPFQCTGENKNYFKGDLKKLTRNRSRFFVIGDFNAKHQSWNNSKANSNGKILFNDLSSGHYSVLFPNGPTCFSSVRNPSTIDLVLTNQNEFCGPLETHADFDSDHLPVTFSISHEAVTRPNCSVFNYHKANWDRYQHHIVNYLNQDFVLETKADIDSALDHLINTILDARNISIPKVQVKFDSHIIDDDLQFLIRLKNIRRRQHQRSHDPLMKQIYKDLQKMIDHRFTLLRNEKFARDVEQIKPYSKPFWKLSKVLKKPQKPIPALKDGENILLTNDEKAQKLAKQFESAHNFNLDVLSPIENEILMELQDINNQQFSSDEVFNTDLNEIKSIIKKFKNMKAPGEDGIFYILIKKLPESTLMSLVKIFNKCFDLAYFPDSWKNAKVIPILKPDKNPAEASSYRPISLLSSISKLFERIILNRMMTHINENSIFADEQFGFRLGHSTTHQLLRVANLIQSNKSEGFFFV